MPTAGKILVISQAWAVGVEEGLLRISQLGRGDAGEIEDPWDLVFGPEELKEFPEMTPK